MTISPEQSRAARALLGWPQTKLAARAHLSESTVRDFEKGRRTPTTNNLAAIRAALERAGVEFTNGDQPGVRLKRKTPRAPRTHALSAAKAALARSRR
jgi:transcriptional regulator with XRE-family HTH domain